MEVLQWVLGHLIVLISYTEWMAAMVEDIDEFEMLLQYRTACWRGSI